MSIPVRRHRVAPAHSGARLAIGRSLRDAQAVRAGGWAMHLWSSTIAGLETPRDKNETCSNCQHTTTRLILSARGRSSG